MRSTALFRCVLCCLSLGWATHPLLAESKKWVGHGNSPAWSDPANWEPSGVPASGDSVQIATAAVTLDTAVDAGDLELGGSLLGPGSLTVNGKFTWSGGEIGGSGSAEFKGETTITGSVGFHRNIRNSGQLTWAGGDLDLGAGLRFVNAGTWNIACDRTTVFGTADRRFVFENLTSGIINKSSGTGKASLYSTIINHGSLGAMSGTLMLSGTSTNFGSYTAGGGTLELSGTHYIWSGGRLGGSGTVAVTGGTTTLYGPMDVSGSTRVAGGILAVEWGATTAGLLLGSGGGITGAFDLTVSGLFTWDASSGSSSSLSGSGGLLANGGMEISGAGDKTLSQRRLISSGNILWSNGAIVLGQGATLQNDGSLSIEGGPRISAGTSPAPLLVNNGAIVLLGGLNECSIGVALQNNGTVSVASNPGRLILSKGSTNTGSFETVAGAILEFGGGNHSLLTASSVSGAGTVRVSGGVASFAGSYSATDRTEITGGIAEFLAPDSTTGTLAVNGGGELAGSGTLTVNNRLIWSAGSGTAATMSGTGQLIVNSDADIAGAGDKRLSGRTIVLQGTTTWSSGPFYGYRGARLVNRGTYRLKAAGEMGWNPGTGVATEPKGVLDNQGVVVKVDSGTTSDVADLGWRLSNAGMLRVEKGTLRLTLDGTSEGSVNVEASGSLVFFGGAYTFRTNASFTALGPVEFRYNGPYVIGGTVNLADAKITEGHVHFEADDALVRNLTLTSGSLGGYGQLTVGGAFVWDAPANSDSTIDDPGTLRVTGTTEIRNSRLRYLVRHRLETVGPATWSDGPIEMSGGALWQNEGTLDVRKDLSLQSRSGGGTFLNKGTLLKSGGIGAGASFDPMLINEGTVDVEQGTLMLWQGGSTNGTFIVEGILNIKGRYAILGPATGSGTVYVASGASLALGDGYAVAGSLTLDGGTVTCVNGSAKPGVLTFLSGTLQASGNSMMSVQARATLDSPGAKNLTDIVLQTSGNAYWTGGDIIAGIGAVLENLGTFSIQSDTNGLILRQGSAPTSQWVNRGTVTVDNASHARVDVPVEHEGLLSFKGGTLSLAAGGRSKGQVDCSGGTLELQGGNFMFEAASQTTGSGTVKVFTPLVVQGGWDVQGSTIAGSGASITFEMDARSGELGLMSGSTIAGPANIQVSRQFTWLGGKLVGSGTLTSAAEGAIAPFVNPDHMLDGRTLVLRGITSWSGVDVRVQGGGTLVNEGELSLSSANSITLGAGGGTFANRGTFQKVTSGGNATIAPPFENSGAIIVATGTLRFTGGGIGSGAYSVQDGATLEFSGAACDLRAASYTGGAGSVLFGANVRIGPGFATSGASRIASGSVLLEMGATQLFNSPGSLQVDKGAQFKVQGGTFQNRGLISGEGTIDVTESVLQDLGWVAPGRSPGLLTINGNYMQAPAGRLQIELAGRTPGTEHDQVRITGPATINGELDVTLLNNFVPRLGDTFTILSTPSLTGVFSRTTAPRFTNDLTLVPLYGPNGVTLIFTNSPVTPPQLSSTFVGTELTLSWPGEFVLESTPSLSPPVEWNAVTNVVGQGTMRSFQADTRLRPQGFFRLRHD